MSEIHELGLDNSTQDDNTCLTGPAIQIIGETECFGNKKELYQSGKRSQSTKCYLLCLSGQDSHLCVCGRACVLVFLVLDLDILPGTEVTQYPNNLPVLVGVTLAEATAMGVTAIGLQQVQHSQLSEQIHEDLGLVQQSIVTLQNQFDSLVAVVLQNHRGLGLITLGKGGICVFLGEECCFYTNQSGIVRENARQLLERIKARERNKETFWNIGWKSWAPWVAPLVGPLTVLLML
jgi:hypothetical protein